MANYADILICDFATGALHWKARPGGDRATLAFNARFAGKPALISIDSHGYRSGKINGKHVLAHRVIWELHYGRAPSEIDHLNGNRADNRIANLREVTRSQNQRNRALAANSNTGFPGVYWWADRNAFRVVCAKKHIGMFPTLAKAIAARHKAENEMGFHPNHGRPLTPGKAA